MCSRFRFGILWSCLFLPCSAGLFAQTTAPSSPPPPPQDPYIIEDGGFSIEPFYWLNSAQPTLRGGQSATAFTDYDYAGNANNSLGGILSIPAGRSNTLRISYFRSQGHADATLSQDATLFSEAYSAGDFINGSYNIQNAKISWDYLSYTWRNHSNIRLKTLYEVQFTTVSANFDAPLKPITTDSSGNTDTNTGHGSKNLVLPTLGAELEGSLNKRFRWEVKGSGFGLPHRADIWDAEGTLYCRVKQFELLAGEKGYHFKTSPQSTEYFTHTLYGAYVGIRYYWGGER
ncbi:MAG: hypothetical protein JO108_37220 [Acidobacteriaceae bacterium]|nr:hypothetical protein [Acidobacteriaceae bacterium]